MPIEEKAVAAVEFSYSDGEPMAYAEVMVFSPENSEVEHQNGRTDRHGKFVFCTDMPGEWRISANDGMGHRCDSKVEVHRGSLTGQPDAPQDASEVAHPVEGSKTLKIIAGLSLIWNFGFAAHFLRQRSHAAERRS
jgi:nickel transport protein